MVKQRSKAPASGDKGGQVRSDEEIIKERKCLEAFDSADTYLAAVGWGLLALAATWFVCFSDSTQVGSSLHQGAADASLALWVSGGFCRGISKASPRLWSAWRLAFHLAWCPVGAIIALSAAGLTMQSSRTISSNTCWCLVLGCGAAAFGAVVTFPGTSVRSGKGSDAYLGRCLLTGDGLAVMALAVSIVLGTSWSESLGPITTAMTALPLLLWAGALCLCRTDAELLVAVPWAMTFLIGASLRSWYYSGLATAAPTFALTVVHAYLYLPLGSDPDANPFYMSLARIARQTKRLMSQPVSGFGDDGE